MPGRTFHDRGGLYGVAEGAKRAVVVHVMAVAVVARVLPASVNDGGALGQLAEELHIDRLELLLVDRGMNARRALSTRLNIKVERVGWDAPSPISRPIRHAWRVEVAHGKFLRSR